jgi:methylmalonyl-CoA mutase cobalamin-binding subunit
MTDLLNSSISDVERDTGLAKETLRVWERRYGFPQPQRDQYGDRVYPPDQVARLRLVKRLIDLGHRPGKLVGLDEPMLHELAVRSAPPLPAVAAPPAGAPQASRFIALAKSQDLPRLRQLLRQAETELGLENFIVTVAAPLTTAMGACWASGELSVFEEHLITEALQGLLRSAIFALPPVRARNRPSVLMTTFPQEKHGLGLLMAEALLTLHGARCVSLGVQTPLAEVAAACAAQPVDIVALSFSSAMHPRQIADGVRDLRQRLAPGCAIWAGGVHAKFAVRAEAGVRLIEFGDIAAALSGWRGQSAA